MGGRDSISYTHTQTERERDRQRQTDRQTEADRQTDRAGQTDTADRQKQTDRPKQSLARLTKNTAFPAATFSSVCIKAADDVNGSDLGQARLQCETFFI